MAVTFEELEQEMERRKLPHTEREAARKRLRDKLAMERQGKKEEAEARSMPTLEELNEEMNRRGYDQRTQNYYRSSFILKKEGTSPEKIKKNVITQEKELATIPSWPELEAQMSKLGLSEEEKEAGRRKLFALKLEEKLQGTKLRKTFDTIGTVTAPLRGAMEGYVQGRTLGGAKWLSDNVEIAPGPHADAMREMIDPFESEVENYIAQHPFYANYLSAKLKRERQGFEIGYDLGHIGGTWTSGAQIIGALGKALSGWKALSFLRPLQEATRTADFALKREKYIESIAGRGIKPDKMPNLIKRIRETLKGPMKTPELAELATARMKLQGVKALKGSSEAALLFGLDEYLRIANNPEYADLDGADVLRRVGHQAAVGGLCGAAIHVLAAPFSRIYETGGYYLKAAPDDLRLWEAFIQRQPPINPLRWLPKPEAYAAVQAAKERAKAEAGKAADEQVMAHLGEYFRLLGPNEVNRLAAQDAARKAPMQGGFIGRLSQWMRAAGKGKEAAAKELETGLYHAFQGYDPAAIAAVGRGKYPPRIADKKLKTLTISGGEMRTGEVSELDYRMYQWLKKFTEKHKTGATKEDLDAAYLAYRGLQDWRNEIMKMLVQSKKMPADKAEYWMDQYGKMYLSQGGRERLTRIAEMTGMRQMLDRMGVWKYSPQELEAAGKSKELRSILEQVYGKEWKSEMERMARQGEAPRAGEGVFFVNPITEANWEKQLNRMKNLESATEGFYSPSQYRGEAQAAIKRAKAGDTADFRRLAAETAGDPRVGELATASDIVVPVPSANHKNAEMLADTIEQVYGKPTVAAVKSKFSTRAKQVGKGVAEREAAVKDVFEVIAPEAVAGKRVLLVDDVVTTGATAREIAGKLREAGAAEVRIVLTAATLKKTAHQAREGFIVLRPGTRSELTGEKITDDFAAEVLKHTESAKKAYGDDIVTQAVEPFTRGERLSRGMDETPLSIWGTLVEMHNRLEDTRFWNALAANRRFVLREGNQIPKGWRQVTDKDGVSELEGLWVSPMVYKDIKAMEEARNIAGEMYLAGMSNWRLFMTVLNPATHGRNSMGNVFFSMMDEFHEDRHKSYSAKAYNSIKKIVAGESDPLLQEVAKFGATEMHWFTREGRKLSEQFKSLGWGADGPKSTAEITQGILRASQQNIARSTAGRMYGSEDMFFKLRAYLRNKAPISEGGRGLAPRDAWAQVQRNYPNYERVPDALAGGHIFSWKNNPAGAPFISFQYETARIMMNHILERPVRVLAAMNVPHFINRYSQYHFGLTDQDMAEILTTAAPYQPANFHHVLLPIRGSDGQYLTWNMNYVWPSADMINMWPELEANYIQTAFDVDLPEDMLNPRRDMKPWDRAIEAFAPTGKGQQIFNRFFFANPAATGVSEFTTGKNIFTGQDFVPRNITEEEFPQEYRKRRYHDPLVRQLLPPLTVLPYATRDAEGDLRLGTDYPKGKTYTGGYAGRKVMEAILGEDIVASRAIERYRNPAVTLIDSVFGFQMREKQVSDHAAQARDRLELKLRDKSGAILTLVDQDEKLTAKERREVSKWIREGEVTKVLASPGLSTEQKRRVTAWLDERDMILTQIDHLDALMAKWGLREEKASG